jgi:ectoine hydroxylase-related dioxygenase (phytanoyl-CoA dioxygenase family)
MSTATTPIARELTADETAHYQEYGWAKIEGLISPELAHEMLETVQDKLLSADTGEVHAGAIKASESVDRIHDRDMWRDWHFPARDDQLEPIRSLAYSREIGRNAALAIGREVGINYHADLIAVKMQQGHVSSRPTGVHQDWVNFPFDRIGFLTFWIALDTITADQGAMRFYNGSHHEGPLGKMGLDGPELPDYYPHLAEKYPLSEPLDLQPGDATIHNGMVVHGAPENTTDRPRWTLILAYHPSDTCYTGAPHHIFKADMGLEVGKPIKHELFPCIYHP